MYLRPSRANSGALEAMPETLCRSRMVCSVHGKNEYKDGEEDWQAVALPKYLLRISDDSLGVRDIREAYALIEKRVPDCWPCKALYRCEKHPTRSLTQVWASFADAQIAKGKVAEVVLLGASWAAACDSPPRGSGGEPRNGQSPGEAVARGSGG